MMRATRLPEPPSRRRRAPVVRRARRAARGALLAVLLAAPAWAEPAPARRVALEPWQAPLAALPVVARIRVPVGPAWLGVGFGAVWVSKSESHAVLRLDPATDRVVATIPVGRDPELGVAIGFGSVWVADPKDRTLTRIDPATNRVVRTIPVALGADPEGSIGVGAGSLWLLTDDGGTDSGTLARIDAASGRVTARIPVRPGSRAVVFAFGSAWVAGTGSGTLARVDPRLERVVAEVPVRARPRFMAAGAGSLWVLCQGDGSLARIDPALDRVTATIEVGVPGEGGDLVVADGYVWVSAEGVPLTQIDPGTQRVRRQFVGGRKDDTLRVGFGSAWIVDEDHGEIWRVDLRALGRRAAGAPRP
jgi:DNA-binding beta-propeller fold protein YncE